MGRKNRVSYFYDPEVSQYYYGQGHPMKPHRLRMAHSLILHYGLHKQMQMYKPTLARAEDMAAFHSEDYLQFLQNVGPGNQDLYRSEVEKYALGEDCPIWDGMYHFSQISAGGSIGAAVQLNYGQADVAINWAGGLHHAKKSEASGFCYINDIVLAILELLKYHQRVLYIDIDVHHGDGVEEAFLTTDRVLTVSLHKFGDRFFPGTGDLLNVGNGRGKYYSINVPLRDGITDDTYQGLFKPLMTQVMERYQPGAVVLQCGADSLAGDKLGVFSLSLRGHAACISFMRSFGVPLMLLGGGGYRMSNVARCWAYETGVALGHDLDGDLPPHEFLNYYSPDFRLHVPPPSGLENINSKESLDRMLATLLQHVSHIQPVAPAGFHERAPDAPRTHAAQGQGDEDEDMVGGGA